MDRISLFFFALAVFCVVINGVAVGQRNVYLLNLDFFTEYNDNIYLVDSDEEDDVISGVEISFSGDRSTRISDLSFGYNLSRVFYWQESDNSAFRHYLFLNYNRYLSRNLLLEFDSSYYRTEESIEPSEEVFRERRQSREPYYRINSSLTLSYEYLQDSFIKLGFRVNYLQNEDPFVEDSRIYTEFISITKDFVWWFAGLDFDFTQREFETTEPVNTWGVGSKVGYKLAHNKDIYFRFAAERTQNIGYEDKDYWTYNFSLNYRWRPEKDQEYHFSAGYYVRDEDGSGKENEGYTFSVSYIKKFKHASLGIKGSGGYRYEYGEAQNTGFTEYYLINLNYNQNLSRTLSFAASAFYRTEDFKDRNSEDEDTYGISLALKKQFTPKLSGSLRYSFRAADSDYPNEDYTVNTIIFTLNYSFWQSKTFPILPKLWPL